MKEKMKTDSQRGKKQAMKKRKGWIYRHLADLKLAQKVMLVYAVALGLCLLVCICALQLAFNIYDSKLYEKSLQELDFFAQRINRSMEEVEDVSYYIALDTKIQEQLFQLKQEKYFSTEFGYEVYQLRMLFNGELYKSDLIRNIYYTDGGDISFTAGLDAGFPEAQRYEDFMNEIHEAKGAYVFLNPTADFPYLLSGRDIRRHIDASLKYLGTVLITSDVKKMIEKNISSLSAENIDLYVYSEDGPIYENREGIARELPNISGEKGYRVVSKNHQKYFMCWLKSKDTGWTYVNAFPYSQIYGQTHVLRWLLIGSFVMLFVTSAILLNRVSGFIVRPLNQLTESMEIVVKGDFKRAGAYLDEEERADEVGILTREFKLTMDKIDHLIHENYEKQLLLQDTRYRMLQAQINPHFLYNTLNSIHWTIRSGQNEEAAKMTVALGTILRAALSREPYFCMKEELDILKKYIMIQEYRYRRRAEITVETEVEEDALIPHMTIQPLVENALAHGADEMLETCRICVLVKQENDTIQICVEDNGPGMSPERLKAVRAFQTDQKGHGIGLKNIYERLKMAFGEKMAFEIISSPGKGTRIAIQIPVVKGDGQIV